jgi:hypothetical protein
MVKKTEENVIQRIFLRNTVTVMCAVRKWLWNAGRWAPVSTKVNGETRERLGQSAKRSAAVRGQAGRGATVAGRRLECYMAVKRHILRQKCAKKKCQKHVEIL